MEGLAIVSRRNEGLDAPLATHLKPDVGRASVDLKSKLLCAAWCIVV